MSKPETMRAVTWIILPKLLEQNIASGSYDVHFKPGDIKDFSITKKSIHPENEILITAYYDGVNIVKFTINGLPQQK